MKNHINLKKIPAKIGLDQRGLQNIEQSVYNEYKAYHAGDTPDALSLYIFYLIDNKSTQSNGSSNKN